MAGPNEPPRKHHRERAGSRPPPAESIAEWIVAAFGLLLSSGAIAWMLFQAVAGTSTPPSITVMSEAIEEQPQRHLVTFIATNQGTSTASNVTIQGTLSSAEGTVETAQTTVDYVPGRSKRSGGLYFTRDPSRYQLELRAMGYEKP